MTAAWDQIELEPPVAISDPFLPSDHTGMLIHADPSHSPYWSVGGVDGRRRLDPFLAGLAAHLHDDGVALSTTVLLHPAKAAFLVPAVRVQYADAGISRIGPYTTDLRNLRRLRGMSVRADRTPRPRSGGGRRAAPGEGVCHAPRTLARIASLRDISHCVGEVYDHGAHVWSRPTVKVQCMANVAQVIPTGEMPHHPPWRGLRRP
jgi:hypothetical protein